MYNAFAVRDSRGLAPKGWHVPSIDEMYNAVNSLDMILANKPYFDVFGGWLINTDTQTLTSFFYLLYD